MYLVRNLALDSKVHLSGISKSCPLLSVTSSFIVLIYEPAQNFARIQSSQKHSFGTALVLFYESGTASLTASKQAAESVHAKCTIHKEREANLGSQDEDKH